MRRAASVRLRPDPARVITRPFLPGSDVLPDGSTRLQRVVARILALSEAEVADALHATRRLFAARHRDLDGIFARSLALVVPEIGGPEVDLAALSDDRRNLIGACLTHEYAIEAAALGNPSIVAAPDQTGLAAGEVRFVMSLRAIGEGHTSSIEFRSGTVAADGSVHVDAPSGFAVTGARRPHHHEKSLFATKLADFRMSNEVEEWVLARLAERFTMAELESAIADLGDAGFDGSLSGETTRLLHWLASSNYRVSFPPDVELSERVLFPSGLTESHGMEDARFVRFVDDDGTVTYYATYTAFDGHQILPQLIETTDFTDFRVTTLSGRGARNKGIALFPRRVGGRFVALGRHDNVNNYVMTSADVRVWGQATLLQEPVRPWELIQLGNCGSPVETDAGWIVITHGVGPMRRYTLGALLLDRDDPTRVIGQLDEPLLSPEGDEREGYVPNVVYSCGSMVHAGHLVVPYGYSDMGTRVATIPVAELVARLTS